MLPDLQNESKSDQTTADEVFSFSSFRAKLEQKSASSKLVVVNLDEHNKQQRDKKRQDLKKKSEASTFLHSYHDVVIAESIAEAGKRDVDVDVDVNGGSQTVSLQEVREEGGESAHNVVPLKPTPTPTPPTEDMGDDTDGRAAADVDCPSDEELQEVEPEEIDEEELAERVKALDVCLPSESGNEGSSTEEQDKLSMKTTMAPDSFLENHVLETFDITEIPEDKHLLAPPERKYMNMFSCCRENDWE